MMKTQKLLAVGFIIFASLLALVGRRVVHIAAQSKPVVSSSPVSHSAAQHIISEDNDPASPGPEIDGLLNLKDHTTEVPGVASAVQSPAGNWHIETVDSSEDVGQDASLALDESTHPHISYYDGNNGNLKYAWHDGTTWHLETVDSAGTVGLNSSLALDESGHPHISYYDSTNQDLKYARHDESTWHIKVVDSEGQVGPNSSLALDSLGHPHVSYYDNANQDLKYARHDGTTWHIEIVDGKGRGGSNSSLALDKMDQPHLGYCSLIQACFWGPCTFICADLKYAQYDGMVWQTEALDITGTQGWSSSLALDEEDRPHLSYYARSSVSYYDWRTAALKYAYHDGDAWHVEKVGQDGGIDTSLALDESGQPHISYSGDNVKYARRDGAAWHIEVVDHNGRWPTSLALDSLGRPHISYRGWGGDLKYAWLASSLHLEKQATPNRNLRNNKVLTYTLTLSGPGLNVYLWDPLPNIVRYVPNSLTEAVTPTAVYSPTAHAISWRGTLPTGTVQTIQFQVTPGVTGTGSLDLSGPIVNTAWLTDTESGWSTSATTIVNGWCLYLPLLLRP